MYSAIHGYTDYLQLLIGKEDVDLNYQDRDGQTALSHAVRNGNEKVIRILLRNDRVDLNC